MHALSTVRDLRSAAEPVRSLARTSGPLVESEAHLASGTCGGCHLTLTQDHFDLMARHPKEWFRCATPGCQWVWITWGARLAEQFNAEPIELARVHPVFPLTGSPRLL
jgi:hypothetical protein